MSGWRTEDDGLGEWQVEADALHGIHGVRARENFDLAGRGVHPGLLRAFGSVKLACARVNAVLGAWPQAKAEAILAACEELARGELLEHLDLDALQGGAGTSTNLAVDEVLANRALQLMGEAPGRSDLVHPLEDLNRHQSTNDVYPSALKVAALRGLAELERAVTGLTEAYQAKEKAFAGVVKVGRTQLVDGVLITLGREMGAYADAFARDRWRISKCGERLRVVNLGGTAVGTGITAPRKYIFQVVEELRRETGLGLARAENLVECTQNLDAVAEVGGILGALAVNLQKAGSDLRLLGPVYGEVILPPRQAGSSIMPGKVNPVIPEAVIQAAMSVRFGMGLLTDACAQGNLELNPFLPLIADTLLNGIDTLQRACRALAERCVAGLEADTQRCRDNLAASTAAVTALVEPLGYDRAQEVAHRVRETGRTVAEVVAEMGLMQPGEFAALFTPERVNRLGSPDGGGQ